MFLCYLFNVSLSNHLNQYYFEGLADPHAIGIAISALDAVQLVGMPESDVIIAQTAVYLARAPKSREVQTIMPHQLIPIANNPLFLRTFHLYSSHHHYHHPTDRSSIGRM